MLCVALTLLLLRWVWLGESGVRAGGTRVLLRRTRRVMLHGGEGVRDVIHGTLHQLGYNCYG